MEEAIHSNTTSYVLGHDDGWSTSEDTKQDRCRSCLPYPTLLEMVQQIEKSRFFDLFFLAIIAIDCIMIGFTITDSVENNPELQEVLLFVEYIFLLVFTLEMAIALISRGPRLFRSRWFIFNLLVIMLSWAYPPLQVIRGFCILRLFSMMGDMQKIIHALESVLPVFESIAVLLGVIFYVGAVIFTDQYSGMYDEGQVSQDYFGDMGKSMFTLFQVTTGAGWPDIAREIMVTYENAWIPFVVFECVTSFIVVELTVAALCKSVQKMEEIESNIQIHEARSCEAARLEEKLSILQNNIFAGLDGEGISTQNSFRGQGPKWVNETYPTRPTVITFSDRTVSHSSARSHGEYPSRPAALTFSDRNTSHATYATYGSARSSGEEWYEMLAFSFEKQTEDNVERIQAAYNCFSPRFQTFCGSIVNNERFGIAVIFLIILNNILMGIATCEFVRENARTMTAFNIVDFIFLIFFTIELFAQFGYRGMSFFKSGWLKFDLMVIAASWMMLFSQLGFPGISFFTQIQLEVVLASWVMPVLKAVRAFRVFRLFSRVQFMRKIASAVFLVLSKLGVTVGLLLVMFYTFGVIFADLFKDMYEKEQTSQDYFSTLPKTFFTLFQCMTNAGKCVETSLLQIFKKTSSQTSTCTTSTKRLARYRPRSHDNL